MRRRAWDPRSSRRALWRLSARPRRPQALRLFGRVGISKPGIQLIIGHRNTKLAVHVLEADRVVFFVIRIDAVARDPNSVITLIRINDGCAYARMGVDAG